jgi:hypothetical protein
MTTIAATGRVRRRRVAVVVAVLLLGASGLLVLGVLLERHAESGTEHPVVATAELQERHYDESTEATHPEFGFATNASGETAERLTGFSVESPWIVTLGLIASIALGVAVWRRPNRPVVVIVVAFTAAALVLDVLEMSHQVVAGRIGLAAVAGVIAAVRVAVIVGGGYLYRTATVST